MKCGLVILVLACIGVAASGNARADAIMVVQEVNGDVVATVSGSVNLSDLQIHSSWHANPAMGSGYGDLRVGSTGNSYTHFYTGLTGPTSFGTQSSYTAATSGSGLRFGTVAGTYLIVDYTYVDGSTLSSTSTWVGYTFASLGLTQGTYIWTWGSGSNADSLTVNIGASSIPEPTTIALFGLGAVGVAAVRRRRRLS